MAWMNLAPLEVLHNADTPPPEAVDANGSSAQCFQIEVEVRAYGQVRRASAAGRDIYAVTAPIVVAAAMHLVAGRARPGVVGPG